jgi:hypothetical protein
MAYSHAQWAIKVTQAPAGEEGLVSTDCVHQIGLYRSYTLTFLVVILGVGAEAPAVQILRR